MWAKVTKPSSQTKGTSAESFDFLSASRQCVTFQIFFLKEICPNSPVFCPSPHKETYSLTLIKVASALRNEFVLHMNILLESNKLLEASVIFMCMSVGGRPSIVSQKSLKSLSKVSQKSLISLGFDVLFVFSAASLLFAVGASDKTCLLFVLNIVIII